MLVYSVHWVADSELTKGKGRITLKDHDFYFTVLCRCSRDATACLEFLFPLKYQGKFSLCDGVVTIKRYKLDNRNFEIQYMLMDGMKKPLYLRNCKDAIDGYHTTLYQRDVYNKKLLV